MAKQHISRLAAPKSWDVLTKTNKWITRPQPGAHPIKMGISLNVLVRDILKIASTAKEVKSILNKKDVLVDGKVRSEPKYIVGLMDVISLKPTGQNFRLLLTKKGKLFPLPISEEEAKFKLVNLDNKVKIKGGKIQLNLSDGRNVNMDKDEGYETESTVVISIPDNKIKQVIELKKGSPVLLIGGKNIGQIGIVQDIEGDKVIYKEGSASKKTLKKYALALGKDKPIIKISA